MSKNIVISIAILVLMLNLGFAQDAIISRRHADKDFYNMKKIKEVSDLGFFDIKIDQNKIFFHSRHEKISTPLNYENLYNEFNFNNIYSIRDGLNNIYYFRFGWVSFSSNQTVFSNLEWINGKRPEASDIYRDYRFHVCDIDFIQFGRMTLCTIGDSQTWWGDAQNMRRYINDSLDDLIFIGSHTDIYGYGHEGEGGNSTNQLLKRMHNLPKVDYYTLLIGTNDWKKNIDTAYSNIIKLVKYISDFNPDSRIIYLTPIPTTNKERDSFNLRLSEKLQDRLENMNQVEILDLANEMRKNGNWRSDYLSNDGLHQNIEGVKFMADRISERIRVMAN